MSIWQTVTAIPNGTRILNYGYDQCVALANHYHAMLGGSFVPVMSAWQWWSNSYSQVNAIYTRSNVPVAGALFVARYGIYNAPDGHIGIVTKVHGNGTFDTMEQNAGTWRYVGRYTRGMANMLGFLVPINNPANVPLEPTQRKVGANPVKRRADATTQSAEKQPPLDPHGVANFNGWKNGEPINDGISNTDVWFRGISGDWFWSGGFTSQSTAGLTNLNPVAPPAIKANQRQVDPVPVNVRASANAGASLSGSLAANAIVTPEGWVTGQSVQGIAVWYKVQGGYAWAGGFTKEDTGGLIDLNPKTPTPEPVDPPLPTDPTGPTSDRGPGPVLSQIDNWSESAQEFTVKFPRPVKASVDIAMDPTIVETTVLPNGGFNEGRHGVPNHIVLHHVAGNNLSGAINTLSGPEAPTANYVVKDKALVSMVPEEDTPATNTRWKSNQYSVTFEICNDKTNTDKPSAESHETAAWGVARAAMHWGMQLPLRRQVNVFGHKEVSKFSTACPGELDMDWITNRANAIIESTQKEEEPPAPDYSDLKKSIDGLAGLIQKLIDLLKSIFKVS